MTDAWRSKRLADRLAKQLADQLAEQLADRLVERLADRLAAWLISQLAARLSSWLPSWLTAAGRLTAWPGLMVGWPGGDGWAVPWGAIKHRARDVIGQS